MPIEYQFVSIFLGGIWGNSNFGSIAIKESNLIDQGRSESKEENARLYERLLERDKAVTSYVNQIENTKKQDCYLRGVNIGD